MSMTGPGQKRPFATLRQFVRDRTPIEVCEMCSNEIAADHQHLIEPASRKIVCACDACAILFSGRADMRYRRIPRRVRYLPDFRLTVAQWESLMLPINLAFFFDSTSAGRVVALYPSPAGAMESMLNLDSWGEIVRANPLLKQMEPDTEALLVNRIAGARGHPDGQYYLLPIDECYKLVGVIRVRWRGLSGGVEVWEAIATFFAGLKERSASAGEGGNA